MKLDIAIYLPGLPVNHKTLAEKSLGGSETAGLCMARELARLGHHITLCCNTDQPGQHAGITWLPLDQWQPYVRFSPLDVCIVQRIPEVLAHPTSAKVNILWMHDLAMRRNEAKLKGVLWNTDKIFVLSEFQKKQYQDTWQGIPDEQFYITRNGVDLSELDLGGDISRNRKCMVYAARPERGLDNLLGGILPKILAEEPGAELVLCTYDNQMQDLAWFYQQINQLAAQYGDRVKGAGHLTKRKLYRLMASAGVYVYPTPSPVAEHFAEVSPVHGDTIVETVSGPKRIADLVGQSGFHVYSRKASGALGVSLVKGVFCTRRDAEVITLRLRPGRGRNAQKESTLTLTPDHEVMLSDGTYCSAGRLRIGDSVMAVGAIDEKRNGYRVLRATGQQSLYGHRVVMESILGRPLATHETVHHRDLNEGNNEPDNLQVLTHSEHRKLHLETDSPERIADQNSRRSETSKTIWNTPEGRESRRHSALTRWGRKRAGENHVVVGIDYATPADVYCMEVEPDHNFIANGIVVHNCIAAMEAQVCGLPIVTSERGALPETIAPAAGYLVKGDPWSETYQNEFTAAVLDYMQDDAAWNEASHAGRTHGLELGWDHVAKDWTYQLERMIDARTPSNFTLARHLLRHSDIVPLTWLTRQCPSDESLAFARDALKAQYTWAECNNDVTQQAVNTPVPTNSPLEHTVPVRWGPLKAFLDVRPECTHILDYGCWVGGYSYAMKRECGRHVLGVDVSPAAVKAATDHKAECEGDGPGVLAFTVGSHAAPPRGGFTLLGQKPNCLVAMEILEHTLAPWVVVNDLESQLQPGSWVFLTVPFGPWEWASYDTEAVRAHLWHFHPTDLRRMFADKSDFQLQVIPAGLSPLSGEPLGFYNVTYRTNGKPTHAIDLAEHCAAQNPKQTVSASIIAGPGAYKTLHWCLDSLSNFADEIVIVDTGMELEGRRTAQQYQRWHRPVYIVPGSNPIEHGFETPRNESLPHCHGDLIFWIDTDEKLLDGEGLTKYLRPNLFHGYSLKQHHFAIDAQFPPDMPVRLFRNKLGIRWYGMLHEHPEHALNEGPGPVVIVGEANIAHVGYLAESGRRGRFQRNWPLLQRDIEKYPDRKLQKHFLMRDKMLIVGYMLQQNGAQVTPEIRQLCEEVIALYREHFLGKQQFLHIDSLQYYSQACQVLGRGIDVAWSIAAGKGGAQLSQTPQTYRFASAEDAETELKFRTAAAIHPYETAHW